MATDRRGSSIFLIAVYTKSNISFPCSIKAGMSNFQTQRNLSKEKLSIFGKYITNCWPVTAYFIYLQNSYTCKGVEISFMPLSPFTFLKGQNFVEMLEVIQLCSCRLMNACGHSA